jgi:hypothetical protein
VLKINLIPKYIYEKRKARQLVILFVVLVLGVGAGMFGWFAVLNKQKQEITVQVADMEQKKAEVDALTAEAAAEEGKAPPMQSKVSFVEGVMNYNNEYPKLYEELSRYTYSRVLYKSIEPATGTQLKIGARARSVGDCGRYLMNMYRASQLFSSVTIDAVPTYNGDLPGTFDFNVTCTLVKPITAPTYGAAAPTM